MTLYPSLNVSNTKTGDEYARKMGRRKDVVGSVEAYYDNRSFEVTPSLLNDIDRAQARITQQDTEIRISQVNYRAFIVGELKKKYLYDIIQFSLSELLKQKMHGDIRFNIPKECTTNIGSEEEESVFLNKYSLGFVIIGLIIGLSLALSSVSQWYIDIPLAVIIAFIAYLLYSKFSWKKETVLREMAVELTQKIAYTNGLKRLTIEFIDSKLDQEQ